MNNSTLNKLVERTASQIETLEKELGMSKYLIYDWAGNLCFHGIEFDSFEDAWEYLYEKFPDDSEKPSDEQDLQEYEVRERE